VSISVEAPDADVGAVAPPAPPPRRTVVSQPPPSQVPTREIPVGGHPASPSASDEYAIRRRSPWGLFAALALVAAGVAAAAWYLGRKPAPLPPPTVAPPSPSAETVPQPEPPSPADAAPAPQDSAAPPAPGPRPPARASSSSRDVDAEHRRLLASASRKYEAGRFNDAISDYRRAVALRSTAAAHTGYARGEIQTAIAEDGRYAPAWLMLGEIHQAQGRPTQARAAYERFLQLAPKGDQARAVREILERQLR
jgi:tetratricopeptide (TPR) repeat protein